MHAEKYSNDLITNYYELIYAITYNCYFTSGMG